MREPREASHPMEKTAAGVYTNSPTEAAASTALTMQEQERRDGRRAGRWRVYATG